MKYHFYPAVVLIAGVLAAQILFSGLVYFSNISLYQNLWAIKHSGYMIVPNELVMPSLQSIKPAICGGFFFALTTGAGLTLMTFLLVIAWRRYSNQYWLLLGLYLAGTVFFMIKFNYNFPVTLVIILTVAAALFFSLKFFPRSDERGYLFLSIFAGHLVVLILIGLIWMPVIHKDMFVSIRDNLLLSNPIGQKINNFYYKYTLYPAETFKSLDQKLLKSCRISIDDKNLFDQVKMRLIAEDYLPVDEQFIPDLTVDYDNNKLIFLRQAKIIHQCSSNDFLKGSEKILELISDKLDRNKFLRKITFLSLISASPMICYIFLHAFFMAVLFFIKSKIFRITGAAIACLITFTLPAISFYHQPPFDMNNKDITKNLKSDHWQQRVGALKAISELNLSVQHLEMNQFERFIQSPLIAERYWVAKALGSNRSKNSYQLILKLLDDPQPNVVCMAMYSLGKQNHLKTSIVIDEIISRIKISEHWYVQWYAYKTLKRLRWTQEK